MNLLLFRADELGPNQQLRLADRRFQHLLQVHRAQPGQRIRVGRIGGHMGMAEVLEIGPRGASLQVSLDTPPPPKLPVTLVLALPRPKMLRRILRSVAEFGVADVHLINSYRVEKSYWQTPALAAATMEDYFLQGLEQARDTILPTVQLQQRFKPFVEDVLPSLLADKRALLAHPGQAPLAPAGVSEPTVIVIGPEGGFIPYEVEKLQAAGCSIVALGPRILRVENALSSLLGRLLSD